MEQKKNPLISGIISVVPGIINTVASLIRDKKKVAEEHGTLYSPTQPSGTQFVQQEIGKGIQLSSKRIMNIGGTTLIISLAVADITANGLTKLNLSLIGIGALYSIGMSTITFLSERR